MPLVSHAVPLNCQSNFIVAQQLDTNKNNITFQMKKKLCVIDEERKSLDKNELTNPSPQTDFSKKKSPAKKQGFVSG